ncbi:MAG: hypothetical protein AB8B86_04175 [Pseudomonadales bacterium]
MFEFQLTDAIILAVALTMILAICYLAKQVSVNSRAVRSCNRQASLAFASEVYAEVANDGELATLFRSGLNDFSSLSANEKVRMHFFLQSVVILFRDSFNAYNEEVISAEEYESNRAATTAVLRMPGGKVWWQDAQNAFATELRHELNTDTDAQYALGDIYPYFLFEEGELHQPENAAASINSEGGSRIKGNSPTAANEELSESGVVAFNIVEPNWRKGLARRRTRQNFIDR